MVEATTKMTRLLNKIERRLGTKMLNLPEHLTKDKWADVIVEDSLVTFSRYFPNKIRVYIDDSWGRKNGYFLIDDKICDTCEIIGVRDIAWEDFAHDSLKMNGDQGYGIYDYLSNNYGLDDIGLLQMRADHTSLFNNGIYIDFKEPNMIKLTNVTGAEVHRLTRGFPIDLLIKHANNLMTISESKMETFEDLATADVAVFLYNELKYFDGLETVYANIDLKMGDLESKASRREDVISAMKEGYVSAANENQPIILTV